MRRGREYYVEFFFFIRCNKPSAARNYMEMREGKVDVGCFFFTLFGIVFNKSRALNSWLLRSKILIKITRRGNERRESPRMTLYT